MQLSIEAMKSMISSDQPHPWVTTAPPCYLILPDQNSTTPPFFIDLRGCSVVLHINAERSRRKIWRDLPRSAKGRFNSRVPPYVSADRDGSPSQRSIGDSTLLTEDAHKFTILALSLQNSLSTIELPSLSGVRSLYQTEAQAL